MPEETVKKNNSILFIRELASYFMDFLETDFHKRKKPRRSIQLRSINNLLIGLNLNRYPSFRKLVWKTINNSFQKNKLVIERKTYRTVIPSEFFSALKARIKNITENQVDEIFEQLAAEIEKISGEKKDFEISLTACLAAATKILRDRLVGPLIQELETWLSNIHSDDGSLAFMVEDELSTIFCRYLETGITEILKLLSAGRKTDIKKSLKSVLDASDIRTGIFSFFENFQTGDLFDEIYELVRNRTIFDKQEFYLYFCDITFKKEKYPVFYIPFSVTKKSDSFILELDSQVFINKKAIDYITQEYNSENVRKGTLKTISERIIYLARHKKDFSELMNSILKDIVDFFKLDNFIEPGNKEPLVAKNQSIRLSDSCYIALFDKSDEALINDYEEILNKLSDGRSDVAAGFSKLIDDFIHKNPVSFISEIEEEWDRKKISDRLVFKSPVPLNSEQLQILEAVQKDGCKYIIVEGPPGTGKSHTITAIVFDAILKDKSVLVLSDKKEALDVVEDKITETMNKARNDRNFQNPILRLGKIGNTYSQILSSASIDAIKNHLRAVKKDYESIETTIDKYENSLKKHLEDEIQAYKNINLEDLREFFHLEKYFNSTVIPVDIDEILELNQSAGELEKLRHSLLLLKDTLETDDDEFKSEPDILELTGLKINLLKTIPCFRNYLSLLNELLKTLSRIKKAHEKNLPLLFKFEQFSDYDFQELIEFIEKYENEKHWLFGYLFKGAKIKELNRSFQKRFRLSPACFEPHLHLDQLKTIADIFTVANRSKTQFLFNFPFNFDFLFFIHRALTDDRIEKSINKLLELDKELEYLEATLKNYPCTIKKLGIELSSFQTLLRNNLTEMSEDDFKKLARYINLKQKITENFEKIPDSDYIKQINTIEQLLTIQMTTLLDRRVIDFYENNRATARTLRDIIRTKQKFPKHEFLKLKEAFPCILAGIRDYAEYIPLEPEIFDLLIIDEASQVSIAQAFPALLRARKVLILGDKKQFSNVKSAQARSDINREWLTRLKDCFIRYVSDDPEKLVRLEKFNIKTSILEFFEFISNYNTRLLKYFRGYKEIISYSNRYFYSDSLQIMKIRATPIDEVLKFSFIKHDGRKEPVQNTNSLEADFIISCLEDLKKNRSNLSVGIITPHTNQQKLLVEKLGRHADRDYFYEKFNLKIMTFDTCQGEERDIVFYSMVATEEDDRLWGVFIKELENVELEEEGKIKAQRLNVGFSRAKECMHFVLSKPLDKFHGAIGDALRYFYSILTEARKESLSEEIEPESPVEIKVLEWFYRTDFWKLKKHRIELYPRFEIGKYLKQLDKTYNHPNYKVDFLMLYREHSGQQHKIIIEYDGFCEHLMEAIETGGYSYQYYITEKDIYREKVLESYGYSFLRINRFNTGKDPVKKLNDRIKALIENRSLNNDLLGNIHLTVEGLEDGSLKECPKCKIIRDISDFEHTLQFTGYTRVSKFCRFCRGHNLYKRKLIRFSDSKI